MRRVLAFLALVLVAFAPAPLPRSARGDVRPEIMGLWRGNFDLLITADRMIYEPDARPIVFEMRLHARARAFSTHLQPNSIFHEDVSHGIFKVEGDTLTLCYGPACKPRPTAFSGPGAGIYTEVYQRVRR